MQPLERTSETSHLVPPNLTSTPSYLNVVNNLCALVFTAIIIYCSFKDGVTLFSFHPPLMSVGWMMIMTSAINAISPGDLATEWMPIRLRSARHWILQVFGAIIITIGFLIILSNKIIHNKSHFVTLHAKFGLAALVFMFVTSLGGIATLYSLKLKNYIAPIYTKLVHAGIGLITFTLGIITVLLGTFSHWWTFGEILRYSSMILVLLVMLITILRPSLKIYFRLKERFENIN